MEFQRLAEVYEELEQTSSGNKMREILAEFFKKVPEEEIVHTAYLTLGKISADYDEVVLGLAEKSVLKAIAMAGGIDVTKAAKIMQETGDIGLTAEKLLQKKPQPLVPLGKLTVTELFEKLHKIAEISGSGSQDQKASILVSLLQKATPIGAKYVARIVLGTMRLGSGDMAVLDALAIAFTGEKENKEHLEAAYNICPDLGIIAETVAKNGLKGIQKIALKVGRPIKMMLCQRVEALEEIPEKIPGEVTVEAKYDGERVQAHRNSKGKIVLYSRRLENITSQFPDLVEALGKQLPAKEWIVEGEILAVDEKGHPLPFQTLMQRRRKYDVEDYAQKIPVMLKLFDLLYWEGESFLHISYVKRVEKLEKAVKNNPHIMLTERIITEDVAEMEKFFQKMLKAGYEGIIIKSRAPDSEYQAGSRGWNWIKWKKEYAQEIADTFDLVIVGADHGKGKRSGAYGALLCASYNEKEDVFETVCKLGTGLTDEVLEELPEKLKKYKLAHQPPRLRVKKEMEPEVWFEPGIVVEVLAAEVTQSPFHTCANGLALRFPRFVRYRENKKPEQATTSKEIAQMAKK